MSDEAHVLLIYVSLLLSTDAWQIMFDHVEEHAKEWPYQTSSTLTETAPGMLVEDRYRLKAMVDENSSNVERVFPDGSIHIYVPFCASFTCDLQEHPNTCHVKKLNISENGICAKCCCRSEDCANPDAFLQSLQSPRTIEQIIDLMDSLKCRDNWNDFPDLRFRCPERVSMEAMYRAQSFVDPPFGQKTDTSHAAFNSTGHIFGLFFDKKLLSPPQRVKMFKMLQCIIKLHALCKAPLTLNKHFDKEMVFKNLSISQCEAIIVKK